MAEYWKSTPKYWCKHCSVYVRDTKLERANHESTARHQGAVQRSLRELHRNADQKEREKERARREVERLNGVVSGSGGGSGGSGGARPRAYDPPPPQQVSQAERQKQLEQLAELGVNIPTELRGSMAMAGEWTVTSTRVIEDRRAEKQEEGKDAALSASARATGVKRERERTEEEMEQEEAIGGLFKKPRKWGVDSKTLPADQDAELEALLSGPLVRPKKEESEPPPQIKTEEGHHWEALPPDSDAAVSPVNEAPSPPVKKEVEQEEGAGASHPPSTAGAEGGAVVFKKRKPKHIQQK